MPARHSTHSDYRQRYHRGHRGDLREGDRADRRPGQASGPAAQPPTAPVGPPPSPATRSARQRTMGMQWIADINRIGNVEELPAVRRLDAVVTSKIEGVDGGRPVRLTIGIRADDAQGFLQCVVCLNGVVASMPTPGHLHRVIVSIEIVGGLVQIAIAISRHRIIQWAVKLRISVSRVRSAQHRPKRDQVEIAFETAAACQVPASVPYRQLPQSFATALAA